MSIKTIIKNKERRLLSKTWRTALEMREVERNNYNVTGNIKLARDFVYVAARYKEHPPVTRVKPVEAVIVFSRIDAQQTNQLVA